MACHFRIASDNARGLPEVSLGVIPGYGGTQRLPQLIGKGRAMEMIMTAGMVTADEAYRTGLVNHVVPQVELWNSVMEWHKNHENSPLAISKAIKSINANYKDGENGFETEIKSFGKCSDFKEGTAGEEDN
jgi:enoyl-CoA hydratase